MKMLHFKINGHHRTVMVKNSHWSNSNIYKFDDTTWYKFYDYYYYYYYGVHTVESRQRLSRIAPQYPKKLIRNIIAPQMIKTYASCSITAG